MAGMDREALIDLWRGEAEEARAQAARMKDGSISQELLLSIAASSASSSRPPALAPDEASGRAERGCDADARHEAARVNPQPTAEPKLKADCSIKA